MFVAKWNLNHLTGIQEVDQRHRQLVDMLGEAYEAFVVGINIEELFVDELVYSMAHCFDREEVWMIENSYPEYSQHKKEHELFTERLLEIRRNYRHDAETSVDLLVFLSNFMNHHIQHMDSRLGFSHSLSGAQPPSATGMTGNAKSGGDDW